MITIDTARQLTTEVLAANGRGTLACDSCDAYEIYIDGDAGHDDYATVQHLMEHAAYDHIGGRGIVFTAPVVVWNGKTEREA